MIDKCLCCPNCGDNNNIILHYTNKKTLPYCKCYNCYCISANVITKIEFFKKQRLNKLNKLKIEKL